MRKPGRMSRGSGSTPTVYGALSQQEVADRLGLSRPRIQQLERQALDKMRAAAEKDGLDLESLLGGRPDPWQSGR